MQNDKFIKINLAQLKNNSPLNPPTAAKTEIRLTAPFRPGKIDGSKTTIRVFIMKTYVPGMFVSLFDSPDGRAIWDFLNSPEIVIRMVTATELERPAVEGIEEQLLERFGDVLYSEDLPKNDRIKQMIGHMVRQIMEARGYAIAVQGVKVTNGAPFSRATRYHMPGETTFHVFQSSTDSRELALTAEKAGTLLQAATGGQNWVYWKSFRGKLRGSVAFGLQDEKKARDDIAARGYHRYRLERIMRAPK